MNKSLHYQFKDRRLNARASKCFERVSKSPAQSFPKTFSIEKGELEGFYRFLHNPKVTLDLLEAAAFEETSANLGGVKEAIAIHDSSLIQPLSKAEVIKEFSERGGFTLHASLVASAELESQELFGLGAVCMLTSLRQSEGFYPQERWLANALMCEERFSGSCNLIHLMDREGDISAVWSEMQALGARFVIRMKWNRHIESKKERDEKVFDVIRKCPALFEKQVAISKRSLSALPEKNKRYPAREARLTSLSMAALQVPLKLSDPIEHRPIEDAVMINVVRVWEKKAPQNQRPVEWILMTTEPIGSAEEVERVVELYRRRWLIEEFFKGLKTGCRIESRQLADAESWQRMVSFYLPIVVRILNLRNLSAQSSRSLKCYFTSTQLTILKLKAKERGITRANMSTLVEELARLGGHIKYNGPPGWETLLTGYLKLLEIEEGYDLAMQLQQTTCDK